MKQELLAALAHSLQTRPTEIAYLDKLEERELEDLSRRIAVLELHARDEQYTDTHWEDD
ncbi:MAG: hypothetical protein JJ693_00015 [Acidithiobacillus sp.]|nr:hypothetical protein [Acidithiobacillus sp.]